MAWWDEFYRENVVNPYVDTVGKTAGIMGENIKNAIPNLAAGAAKTGFGVAKNLPGVGLGVLGLRGLYTAADDMTGRRISGTQPVQAQSYGGPDRAVAQQPSMPQEPGVTFDDFLAMLGGGGGGGVDLSGYNSMLSDLTAREGALNDRKAENEAYIKGIIGASRTGTEARQAGLADIVNTQLDNDAARRATEIGLIRGAEDERLNTANAARAALGSTIGADLSSAVAQNQVGGVGATGSVADQNARILENISSQQYSRQLAGLDPMELMANRQLTNTYEDRLGALGSERAAIQGQIAAARASANRGPSLSERMNAFGMYQDMYGPGEAVEAPGGLGVLQQYMNASPENANLYQNLYNNMETLASGIPFYDVMNNKRNPLEVASEIQAANPELGGPAMDFLIDLIQSYIKVG